MFDVTYLLNEAKYFIGHHLTGQMDFKDEDILNCLKNRTLPIFSVFVPHFVVHTLENEHDAVPGSEGKFFIKVPFTIIRINKLLSPDFLGGFGDSEFFSTPVCPEQVVEYQQLVDRFSMSHVTPTVTFEPPNVVNIFPKNYSPSTITVELAVVHPISCQTVPRGAFEKLKELFLADIATDILTTREFFTSLSTEAGQLEMNLDRFRNKADMRRELIESYRNDMLKTSRVQKIWIA